MWIVFILAMGIGGGRTLDGQGLFSTFHPYFASLFKDTCLETIELEHLM